MIHQCLPDISCSKCLLCSPSMKGKERLCKCANAKDVDEMYRTQPLRGLWPTYLPRGPSNPVPPPFRKEECGWLGVEGRGFALGTRYRGQSPCRTMMFCIPLGLEKTTFQVLQFVAIHRDMTSENIAAKRTQLQTRWLDAGTAWNMF